MDELKKQFILIISLVIALFIAILFYKSDFMWNFGKGLPLHTNSGKCIKISNTICLSEDAGLRTTYYEASSICSKRGMKLPTLDNVWEIWISSENCHRKFASNDILPVDKNAFIGACTEDICHSPAEKIKKYCKSEFTIKFPFSSQYKNGSYWVKDKAGENIHYTINYSTGIVGKSPDNEKEHGVRCVK